MILEVSERISYKFSEFFSYKLIRTNSLTFEQATELQKWKETYDFWRPARSGRSTDIMVGPGEHNYLISQLNNLGIVFIEVINDIGSLITSQKMNSLGKNYQGKISFDTYYSHDEVCIHY